jgi:hypothetical protein
MKNFAGLEGWQFRAARVAADWTHRECAEATGLSTTTIMRVEKMNVVHVSDSEFKEPGKVPGSTVQKLLDALETAGFKLVPRTETRKPRVESIE